MILKSLKYFPIILNFKIPFHTSRNTIKTRKVFIVELRDENNKAIYGESAPLPDFSSESFDETEKELRRLSVIDNLAIDNSLQSIYEFVQLQILLHQFR